MLIYLDFAKGKQDVSSEWSDNYMALAWGTTLTVMEGRKSNALEPRLTVVLIHRFHCLLTFPVEQTTVGFLLTATNCLLSCHVFCHSLSQPFTKNFDPGKFIQDSAVRSLLGTCWFATSPPQAGDR
jgi:hypothetical protein